MYGSGATTVRTAHNPRFTRRLIAVDIYTRARFPILNPDSIILGAFPESQELSVESVAARRAFSRNEALSQLNLSPDDREPASASV